MNDLAQCSGVQQVVTARLLAVWKGELGIDLEVIDLEVIERIGLVTQDGIISFSAVLTVTAFD